MKLSCGAGEEQTRVDYVAVGRTPDHELPLGGGHRGHCYVAGAAEERTPCAGPELELELDSKSDWAAEIPALRARLRELDHVDACAHVVIRAEANGVSVDVASKGRSASRLLTDPRELVRTVEALVVLPPPLPTLHHVAPVDFRPARPNPFRVLKRRVGWSSAGAHRSASAAGR